MLKIKKQLFYSMIQERWEKMLILLSLSLSLFFTSTVMANNESAEITYTDDTSISSVEKSKKEDEKENNTNNKDVNSTSTSTSTSTSAMTSAEENFKDLSAHEVYCSGCLDKYIGNLSNLIKLTVKSTGNRIDLENTLVRNVISEQLKKDVLDLASKFLEKDKLEIKDQLEMMELLKVTQDLFIKPTIKRIHVLRSKDKLTTEEHDELRKISDRLTSLTKDDVLNQLWKKSIGQFKDRTLAREIRKALVISEYYTKFIKTPKRTYAKVRVKMDQVDMANNDQTLYGIEKFLFGNPNARSAEAIGGVIGAYEKEADDLEKESELIAKIEAKKQQEKEIRDERDDRIKDGEVLSQEVIEKAKLHHKQYLTYHNEMQTKCAALFTPTQQKSCQRAQVEFNKIGKGYHLRKMFDLLETARKDKQQEDKVQMIKQMREEYLGKSFYDPETGEGANATDAENQNYSLFDGDEEHGEYADGFPKSQDRAQKMNQRFDMGPVNRAQTGRMPVAMNPTSANTNFYSPYQSYPPYNDPYMNSNAQQMMMMGPQGQFGGGYGGSYGYNMGLPPMGAQMGPGMGANYYGQMPMGYGGYGMNSGMGAGMNMGMGMGAGTGMMAPGFGSPQGYNMPFAF